MSLNKFCYEWGMAESPLAGKEIGLKTCKNANIYPQLFVSFAINIHGSETFT